METTNLQKTIGQIFDGSSKYVIPLYQRNFAWRQEQIEQLLQDIHEASKKTESHYFIGSLVVLKRNNGDFEVIDGQQRLTTLSLITKILGINKEPRLFYDSRPEVEDFFSTFYKTDDNKVKLDYPSISHLKNAIEYIQNAELDPNNLGIKLSSPDFALDKFKNYFSNNVFLVRVEIPEDTDVASYFEIMNNRGEQLQKHEILKSLMMSKIADDNARKEFALIWEACSQMDTPIQKLFDVELRKKYFGDNYDEFKFENLNQNEEGINDDKKEKGGKSIDEILGDTEFTPKDWKPYPEDNSDIEETESKYKSIIDFPNFLMHVLKLYLKKDDIPLNEKYLLVKYKENEEKITPEDFIQKLFYSRTVFDRYIVKTIVDNNDKEDGERWTLRKPHKKEKSWEYVNTFEDDNDKIIKALSVLQVSFRNRTYKNWLYDVLRWLVERYNTNTSIEIDTQVYIQQLNGIMFEHFKNLNLEIKKIGEDEELSRDNSYSQGTNTSHFLFNFIDYLYWVDSKSQSNQLESSKFVKDFDFKYWNSVEHHMAREWAERNSISNKDNFIDNLGNLCLISKGANSRLSDRDVKEKVTTFGNGNLGANRQIMYKMTKNSDGTYSWEEEKIKQHYNELVELLKCGEAILKIHS